MNPLISETPELSSNNKRIENANSLNPRDSMEDIAHTAGETDTHGGVESSEENEGIPEVINRIKYHPRILMEWHDG